MLTPQTDDSSRETAAGQRLVHFFGSPWYGKAGVCSYGGVAEDLFMVSEQAPASHFSHGISNHRINNV